MDDTDLTEKLERPQPEESDSCDTSNTNREPDDEILPCDADESQSSSKSGENATTTVTEPPPLIEQQSSSSSSNSSLQTVSTENDLATIIQQETCDENDSTNQKPSLLSAVADSEIQVLPTTSESAYQESTTTSTVAILEDDKSIESAATLKTTTDQARKLNSTVEKSADAKAKSDKDRIVELRKKSLRSASEWNARLNLTRKLEHSSFNEIQTNLKHYPVRRNQQARVNTSFGNYPVALIPGQYQNYYKSFTTREYAVNPINTVMEPEYFRPRQYCESPEPITVTDADFAVKYDEKPTREKAGKSDRRGSKCSSNLNMNLDRPLVDPKVEPEICAFCCQELQPNDKFVQCIKCGSCGHPTCMDMTDSMYSVIKSYPWMCMECKPCYICSKLDGEDKMLFCDRCDRGYHTFCVGLKELPSGRWICPKYCRKFAATSDNTPSRSSEQCSRSSTPLDAQLGGPIGSCTECNEPFVQRPVTGKSPSKKKRQSTLQISQYQTLCDCCTMKKRKQ